MFGHEALKRRIPPKDYDKVIEEFRKELERRLGVKVHIHEEVKNHVINTYYALGFPLCVCATVVGAHSLCPCPAALAEVPQFGSCFCGLYYIESEDLAKLNGRFSKGLRSILLDEVKDIANSIVNSKPK